jgi:hypothetical protein
MTPVPRWRIAAGIAVLAALAFFMVLFTPVYFRNMELQSYVSDVTRRVENQTKSDDVLRGWVLDKANELKLPVKAGDVHIVHSQDSKVRVDVRYFVTVTLPGYTVNLHFYPGAGSR